jgi:hypothetical protein
MADLREEARARREEHNASTQLLRLPPELRNKIYEYLVPERIDVSRAGLDHELPTLQACRLLREETAPIIYGTARFCLHMRLDISAAYRWIATLTSETKLYRVSVDGYVFLHGVGGYMTSFLEVDVHNKERPFHYGHRCEDGPSLEECAHHRRRCRYNEIIALIPKIPPNDGRKALDKDDVKALIDVWEL